MNTYQQRIRRQVEKTIHSVLHNALAIIAFVFLQMAIWTLPASRDSTDVEVVVLRCVAFLVSALVTYAFSWFVSWPLTYFIFVAPKFMLPTALYVPLQRMAEDIKPLHVHLLANFLLELEMKARVLARVSKEKNALQSTIGAICSEKNIEIDSSEIEISMRAKLQRLERDFQRERAEFFERVRYIWDEAIPGWDIELIIPDRPTQWKDALRFKEWIALKHPTLLSVPFVKRFAPEQSEAES